MLRHAFGFAGILLLAAAAQAQCSTLTATGTGAPGTSVTFALDGTDAHAFAFLVIGDTQGTTTINLGPIGTLTLGLAAPFAPLPIGLTDASGDISRAIPVPSAFPASLDLFAQGVTIGFSFVVGPPPSVSFSLCASNVVGFHVGS
jgi:hypothetical protein